VAIIVGRKSSYLAVIHKDYASRLFLRWFGIHAFLISQVKVWMQNGIGLIASWIRNVEVEDKRAVSTKKERPGVIYSRIQIPSQNRNSVTHLKKRIPKAFGLA
jgi:hypothetical protein